MKRRMVNLLTLLSLLLCVAVVALWARSYSMSYGMRWSDAETHGFTYSRFGRLLMHNTRSSNYGPPHSPRFEYFATRPHRLRDTDSFVRMFRFDAATLRGTRRTEWCRFGFTYASVTNRGLDGVLVSLPLWLAAVITGLLPAVRLRVFLRQRARSRRQKIGSCPRCGYDLRATPDRCPECGQSR